MPSDPLAEAKTRRDAMPKRRALADPIAEKWAQVAETVHWIIADAELADRLLVALANLAPPSVEMVA